MDYNGTSFKVYRYSIRDFFEKFKYIQIPLYQRGYEWGKEQVETLLEFPDKIFDDIKDVKKIHKKIMENSFNLNNFSKIQWKNLRTNYLSTYIDGKLYGEAWSTAIFGQYSKMNLYTAWGAMNADIEYLVYN